MRLRVVRIGIKVLQLETLLTGKVVLATFSLTNSTHYVCYRMLVPMIGYPSSV